MSSKNIGTIKPFAANTSKGEKKTKTKRQIAFPYADLNRAVKLVETIKEKQGTSCEIKQLGAWLGLNPDGGTFSAQQTAAKCFGLLIAERGKGKVFLTDLGKDITDPKKQEVAKIEAFLHVPLYKKMYEEFEGHPLPPSPAIERTMAQWGVPEKQARRARQVFDSSVKSAGFYNEENGWFIKPAIQNEEESAKESIANRSNNTNEDCNAASDPLIIALLSRLPKTNEEWNVEAMETWIDGLRLIFSITYNNPSLKRG